MAGSIFRLWVRLPSYIKGLEKCGICSCIPQPRNQRYAKFTSISSVVFLMDRIPKIYYMKAILSGQQDPYFPGHRVYTDPLLHHR